MKSQLLFATALVVLAGSQAQAQSSSIFGSRGVTGSSGTMSNGVGGQSSGGAGGAQGQGQSGFGASGSMTGFTGSTSSTQSGFLSGSAAGNGLAGQSNTGNFVGNRALGGQNGSVSMQGATGGRGGAAGGRNSLSSGNRLSQQNRNRNSQQNRGASAGAQSTPIRPVQVIGFAPPQKTSENMVASINADVESAVKQGRIPGVSVNADPSGTVTLEGHVATESDRRKAETLIHLEPGVRKVVNRITVSEQPHP